MFFRSILTNKPKINEDVVSNSLHVLIFKSVFIHSNQPESVDYGSKNQNSIKICNNHSFIARGDSMKMKDVRNKVDEYVMQLCIVRWKKKKSVIDIKGKHHAVAVIHYNGCRSGICNNIITLLSY